MRAVPPRGRRDSSSARFARSMASTRSKRSKSAGCTWRARSRKLVAAAARGRHRPPVRRLADVIVGSACRVDFDIEGRELARGDDAQHSLGGGRSADIPEAHEQHPARHGFMARISECPCLAARAWHSARHDEGHGTCAVQGFRNRNRRLDDIDLQQKPVARTAVLERIFHHRLAWRRSAGRNPFLEVTHGRATQAALLYQLLDLLVLPWVGAVVGFHDRRRRIGDRLRILRVDSTIDTVTGGATVSTEVAPIANSRT